MQEYRLNPLALLATLIVCLITHWLGGCWWKALTIMAIIGFISSVAFNED